MKLVDGLHGAKKLVAQLMRFDSSYLRFTGEIRIEHRRADALVDSYTDSAIWELMYLGKTETEQYCNRVGGRRPSALRPTLTGHYAAVLVR
jgi:hypothetical protein